jgi:site-specific DNA-cytosine methylase
VKDVEYFASEVDIYAIQIAKKNYPDTQQLGSVTDICGHYFGHIDLLVGLFWHYVRILKEIQYKNSGVFFLLENVVMKQEWQDVITKALGVEPIKINSALVSAQNRERLYWTNIPFVGMPEDKGVLLKDIVMGGDFPIALHNLYGGFKEKTVRVFEGKSPTIRTSAGGGHIPSFVKKELMHSEKALEYMNRTMKDGRNHWDFKHHSDVNDQKSACVVANFFKGVPYNVFKDWDCIRKFHPVECERLQTLPDGYTEGVSNTQRYKMLGNGFTVDVIAHFLRGMLIR